MGPLTIVWINEASLFRGSTLRGATVKNYYRKPISTIFMFSRTNVEKTIAVF